MKYAVALILSLALMSPDRSHAQAQHNATYGELFEAAWQTIRDNYFDPKFNGADWEAVHRRYQPEVERVRDDRAFLELAYRMMAELHSSHLELTPPQPNGLDVGIYRTLLEKQDVVTSVAVASDAQRQGRRPGDVILNPKDTYGPPGTPAQLRVRGCDGRSRTVAVLINSRTGSAAEGFAWGMKLLTHATLIGHATAGSLLGSEHFDLPGGWTLTVPTHAGWGPDGKPIQDKAVPPDVPVPWSRQDYCDGRDPDVAKALEILTQP